jgi:hypothetical protein
MDMYVQTKDTDIIIIIMMGDRSTIIFIRDNPIFSSERMLHEDYYRKGSVEKKFSGRGSQGAIVETRILCDCLVTSLDAYCHSNRLPIAVIQ